jgi:hypothetical protein
VVGEPLEKAEEDEGVKDEVNEVVEVDVDVEVDSLLRWLSLSDVTLLRASVSFKFVVVSSLALFGCRYLSLLFSRLPLLSTKRNISVVHRLFPRSPPKTRKLSVTGS